MKQRQVHYWILSVIFSLASVAASFFVFPKAFVRCGEALVDLWQSMVYYFTFVTGAGEQPLPGVTRYSDVLGLWFWLPETWEEFQALIDTYCNLLFNAENWNYFVYLLGLWIERISQGLLLALPVLLILYVVAVRIYKTPNNHHNRDTKPLQVFKLVSKKTFEPIKRFVLGFVAFLREKGWLWKLWVGLWAINLNIASIVIGFLAFYFYFAVSCDIGNLFLQVFKLIVDMQFLFIYIPLLGWLAIGYFGLNAFRKHVGYTQLRHMEARNCGLINELPIVTMDCGSMGMKKTTLITDMTLSQEVMFRQKALEIIQRCDMKFPCFPWICFEQELRCCMEHGTVYNLATVRAWVQKKRQRFEKHHNVDLQLYGYDCKKHPVTFRDSLQEHDLFSVLGTYALAYFVYVVESSLIVSNFAVRTDHTQIDEGNFPMWYADFFPKRLTQGRFSKILDFDALRLGKHLVEGNPKIGSFEFGVVAISEIGKERGNNLELKEMKKGTAEANQKNDLFNSWLKMCRHSATIDHFPFIKVFTDEQRPESWGADARDLCDILQIVSSGEQELALPFYTIEEMVSEWAFEKFIGLYYELRFLRGDNTLLMHLLKAVTAFLWRRNLRLHNQFGYSILHIEKERGTMNGKVTRKKYYLMNRKIYARRFSTDCFSDYFDDLAKKSKVGLKDYVAYAGVKATVEELKQQNSYFINSLYR